MNVATLLIALLCQTPIDDVRSFHDAALPVVSVWHCEGHPPAWQIAQGRRIVPTFRLHQNIPNPKKPQQYTEAVEQDAESYRYCQEHRLPIFLRTNNISGVFQFTHRMMAVDGQIPDGSPLIWNTKSGTLADGPIVDMHGDPAIWATEGKAWAATEHVARIRELVTPPKCWIVDNNEGPNDEWKRYTALATPPVKRPDGLFNRVWLADDKLGELSIRFRDSKRDADPYAWLPGYYVLINAQRSALQDAFRAGMTDWPNVGFTGYGAGVERSLPPEHGPIPLSEHFDANSPSYYVGNDVPTDFRSPLHYTNLIGKVPAWDARTSPMTYRELSTSITDAGALGGAVQGRHLPITPDLYRRYMAWVLWSIHKPGTAVCLRIYYPNRTTPEQLFFGPQWHATLEALGLEGLKTATVLDYERPVFDVVDRACTDFREFWTDGEPVAWAPDPASTTVETFLAVRRLKDRALIVRFSAVADPQPVTITIDGIGKATVRGSRYAIVRPPVPTDAVVEEID